MELGRKLRQARLDAGLSQRQLCEGIVTRNMLSQIEHGTARPSMDTLRQLAARLGKTAGFFLDDQPLESANTSAVEQARSCLDAGDYPGVLHALIACGEPDPVFGREMALMKATACLALAEQALAENRKPYALALLEQAEIAGQQSGFDTLIAPRQQTLLAMAGGHVSMLPSLDQELLIRAETALKREDYPRAAALLDAAEDRDSARWHFLRGQVFMKLGEYPAAAEALLIAQANYPETLRMLELCYWEMGDFRRAYEYACLQRGES